MKKIKKNGFTLAELIGVIIIFGIILLIAIPAVTKFLGKSKDLYSEQTIKNIETATQEYFIDHPDEIPIHSANNGYTEIPLNILTNEKYIHPIKNPDTSEVCSDESYIYVTNSGYSTQSVDVQSGNFKLNFDVCLKCGIYRGSETIGSCMNKKRIIGFVNQDNVEIQTITMSKGSTYTLKFRDLVGNRDISYSYVNYTSSNESIATVAYGKLRALNVGTTIIKGNTTKISTGKYKNTYDATYPSYTTYLIVKVVDKPIKITDMTAWTSSARTTKVDKITSGGIKVYVHVKPDTADKTISCSIVDEDNNKVTGYGSTKVLAANTSANSSNLYVCQYTRTAYNSPTSIIDPQTGEVTTHTYMLIKPTKATEDSDYLKIPIYISN